MIEKKQKILVTGAAGFIGFHISKSLIERGNEVVGIDNINNYYNVSLKYARLNNLGVSAEIKEKRNVDEKSSFYPNKIFNSVQYPNFKFVKMDIQDKELLNRLFIEEKIDKVCHLAAQVGVRYSLENPYAYAENNIIGFVNIIEACRQNHIKHLVYASSSSVYGNSDEMPLKTSLHVDRPISLYAATKRSNELIAYSYSHLYRIQTTGLRFFTVYGPWGRPDMAYYIFVKKILEGQPIQIFNNGNMLRDFTYIDDIVEGIIRVIENTTENKDNPYKIYNIGNSSPVLLLNFIEEIEKVLGKKAIKEFMPMQPGDVLNTYADVTELINDYNYIPCTSMQKGVSEFIKWYKSYFKID